jgi:hypothetical protein
MNFLITKFSPHPYCFVPFRPKYSPQHPILKHPIPAFSLIVRDQVSHPYKTRRKIILGQIYIHVFIPTGG